METCSHCGAELPDNATFCPSCGRRTDSPASEPREEPIDVQHARPRYFWLASPVFVFGVLLVLVVLGIVLLVLGALVAGVISIVLGACLLPTFLAGARRWPDTRLARAGVSTADRVRDEADVAAESISTWSTAGRDVVRLRKEQFQLRRERDAKIRELGVSVYEEDGRAEELKAAAKDLDERHSRNERELQRTIGSARRRTRKRRAAVVSTEIIQAEPEQPDEEG
ncbi:MAG: zinc-ribbon domain [Gaiellaceae bacterium]|nr:zinc-ribbon domain [Gaiellaceae bacterium]